MDVNWLLKYADLITAAATILAAGLSTFAAWLAWRIAKRQTGIGAVQDLAKDYAGKEMYDALKCFGDFVKEDNCHATHFRCITCIFDENKFQLTENDLEIEDLRWAITTLENRDDVDSARRRIHHFYKSVWRLSELGALKGRSLKLLTINTTGWALWRDSILPVTWAKALDRKKKEKEFPLPAWGRELIKRVDC